MDNDTGFQLSPELSALREQVRRIIRDEIIPIEKKLDPTLFPTNTQFFESHANATWFPKVVAASIRITHLPLETAIFCWHLLTIFLFLWALWELSGR